MLFSSPLELARDVLDDMTSAFQAGHPYLLAAAFSLGRALLYCCDLAGAKAQTEIVLSSSRDYWGPHDSVTIRGEAQIAIIGIKVGEVEAGWLALREAQAKLRGLGDRGIQQAMRLQVDIDLLLPDGPPSA
jgi:hypothetical protein